MRGRSFSAPFSAGHHRGGVLRRARVGRRPAGEFIVSFDGKFVVTLDNSQVWSRSEISSQAFIEVGDTVTVRRGVPADTHETPQTPAIARGWHERGQELHWLR